MMHKHNKERKPNGLTEFGDYLRWNPTMQTFEPPLIQRLNGTENRSLSASPEVITQKHAPGYRLLKLAVSHIQFTFSHFNHIFFEFNLEIVS